MSFMDIWEMFRVGSDGRSCCDDAIGDSGLIFGSPADR